MTPFGSRRTQWRLGTSKTTNSSLHKETVEKVFYDWQQTVPSQYLLVTTYQGSQSGAGSYDRDIMYRVVKCKPRRAWLVTLASPRYRACAKP